MTTRSLLHAALHTLDIRHRDRLFFGRPAGVRFTQPNLVRPTVSLFHFTRFFSMYSWCMGCRGRWLAYARHKADFCFFS